MAVSLCQIFWGKSQYEVDPPPWAHLSIVKIEHLQSLCFQNTFLISQVHLVAMFGVMTSSQHFKQAASYNEN